MWSICKYLSSFLAAQPEKHKSQSGLSNWCDKISSDLLLTYFLAISGKPGSILKPPAFTQSRWKVPLHFAKWNQNSTLASNWSSWQVQLIINGRKLAGNLNWSGKRWNCLIWNIYLSRVRKTSLKDFALSCQLMKMALLWFMCMRSILVGHCKGASQTLVVNVTTADQDVAPGLGSCLWDMLRWSPWGFLKSRKLCLQSFSVTNELQSSIDSLALTQMSTRHDRNG